MKDGNSANPPDPRDLQVPESEELATLISLGQKYLWKGSRIKAELEANGIQLISGNFYSPVPTMKEIESSWELRGDPLPYLDPKLYDNMAMLNFLNDSLAPFAKDFNPSLEDTGNPAESYWKNSQFSYSDALAYYCIIRHLKPRQIVEVGAGFSSRIAALALQDNGNGGKLILIEPYPSTSLGLLPTNPTLIQKLIQDIPITFFDCLNKGDILFIDSSHAVKAGSDCTYIYLKIIPSIREGVVIHTHDVFLPQMMPEKWLKELHIYWTEQYLLQAYLIDNPKVEVLFGSHYHSLINRAALEIFMAGKFTAAGGSFWYRKKTA